MGAPLTAGQRAFVSHLAGATGLNPGVVTAWVLAEESGSAAQQRQAAGNNDWLNIGYTDSGTFGSGGGEWSNPVRAAQATAAWLRGKNSIPGYGTASPGVQSILHAAGAGPQAQIRAIQHSGWASSGYPDLPGLYNQYGAGAPQAAQAAAQPGGGGSPQLGMPKIPGLPGIPGQTTFNAKAYQLAQNRALLGNLYKSSSNLFGSVPGEIKTPNTLLSSGVLTTQMPDPSKFMQQAQNALGGLAQQAGIPPSQVKVHPGSVGGYKGYINPIAGFSLGRTDQGVDATAKAGTPIRALGDSRLVQVIPDWYGGQPLLLMKILSGPKAGQYWYVAEQINPATTQIGHVFHTGDTVATFAQSGTGIEIGWGSPNSSGRTLAQATTGYTEGQVTPAGTSFLNFIKSL